MMFLSGVLKRNTMIDTITRKWSIREQIPQFALSALYMESFGRNLKLT